MTLPPNRIGASRGPGGATLDDVVAAIGTSNILLGELGVQLSSFTAFLESIANSMTYLAGDPGTRPGAFQGLGQVIGPQQLGNADLYTFVVSMDFLLSEISNRLQNSVSPSLNNIRDSIGTLGTLPVGDEVNLLNRARLLLARLDAISDDLGTITETPAGLPIKGVLNLIALNTERAADCCEESLPDDSELPPQNALPPETESCAENLQGPHQATGLYLLSEGVGGDDLWGIQFAGLEGVSVFAAVNDANEGAAFPGYEAPTDQQLCLVYDLTGNPVPSQGGNVLSGATPPSVTGGGGSSFTFQTGQSSFYRPVLNAGVCFYFRFSVPTGTQPPNFGNFWLYWGDVPV